MLALIVLATATVSAAPRQQTVVDICSRTVEVQTSILAEVSGAVCSTVTGTQLAGITQLAITGYSSASIVSSDFAGLTGLPRLDITDSPGLTTVPANAFSEVTGTLTDLRLPGNKIATVHADAFNGLTALEVLDLHGNAIETLDADIFDGLTALGRLDLEGNAITSLDADTFDGLTNLVSLSFGNNAIETLDADIFDDLTNLTGLGFGNNAIETLDADIFDGLTNLEGLSLNDNAIETLDADIFDDLTALARLYLHGNAITSLDADIFDGLANLRTLGFGNNAIETLDADIFDGLTNLLDVGFGNNAIETLDADIFDGLTNLEGLYFGRNAIETLDADIFNGLTNLTGLYLHGNAITSLDADTFDGLTNLTGLILNDNAIETLDADTFDGLTNLERLQFGGNAITTLDADIFDGLTNLTSLSFNDNTVTTLDADIFDGLTNLVSLSFAYNAIETLDADIFDGLTALEGLYLYGNAIETLDPDIFDGLTNLETLLLYGNAIETLDADIFDGLTNLTSLTLNANDITTLDADIFDDLTSLEVLDLYGNAITTLDADIFDGLTSLERLYFFHNAIETLDADIFDGLTNLVFLSFRSNAIETLDADIFDGLTNLERLHFGNNAIETLDADIFDGLTNLERLHFGNNAIETLDADIFDGLSALQFLYVRDNRVSVLPVDLFDPLDDSLVDLGLSDNSLTDLPDGIFDGLTGLQTLNLSCNFLTALDLDRFDPFATTLTTLDIRRNSFTTPPTETDLRAKLTSLTTLLTGDKLCSVDPAPGAPAFADARTARSVAENTTAGRPIGAPVAAVDPDGDRMTYTLGGTDAASFDIVETSGQLRTKTALNYEGRSSYSVTVSVHDGKDANGDVDTATDDTIDVTIAVGNVDEAGTMSFAQIGDTVAATVSDPDGGVNGEVWQWARSSRRSRGWTDIMSATSASYTPVDDDQGMYLRATASYDDAHGPGKGAQGVSSSQIAPPDLRVTTLVSGLSRPWDIAFTPEGTMLFTQRPGVLSSRLTDGTVQTITADLSDLFANGETGLMGIVVDPRFSSNRRFYTCQGHTGPEVQVIAWTINTDYTAATRVADPLVGGMPASSGRHGGCRLRFGPSGYLWISTGDAATGTVPQDLTSLGGKVLRVNASTGAGVPANPFASSPLIYTYGHRNPQGLALRPGTSQMWSVEHGPSVDDEINLLVAGGNYGWDPVPRYNESVPMTDLVKFPGAVEAKWSSGRPTLATSGAVFLEGRQWGVWEGRLAVATLRDSKLRLFEFTSDGAFVSQVIPPELDGTVGRLRTPMLGPDGALYVTTSNGGGADRILRFGENRAPAFAASETGARSVPENTGAGRNIGAPVEGVDPDEDALVYNLGGTDAASFDIVASSGQLQTKAALDYETKSRYRVTVTAADTSGVSDEITVTITVDNVNEAPAFPASETGARSVPENTAAGRNIGDAGGSHGPGPRRHAHLHPGRGRRRGVRHRRALRPVADQGLHRPRG